MTYPAAPGDQVLLDLGYRAWHRVAACLPHGRLCVWIPEAAGGRLARSPLIVPPALVLGWQPG